MDPDASIQALTASALQKWDQGQRGDMPENAAEWFFEGVGLLRGPWAAPLRVVFGFGVVAIALWAWRPSFMFTPTGAAKAWRSSSADKSPATTTFLPWWMPAALAGSLCGLLV